jgi:serine/threonine-protein kinase
MAYCPKGSLQSLFDAGPMTLAAVRKIGTEVSLGLENLHSVGMLHRDIKPGNILLDASGVAKLGDFGLVTDNLVHGYGSQNGYLDHIAYEIWHGEGTSRKSDIWALGMSLYRLLHGREWYERMSPAKERIKFGSFVESLDWLPHVPKSWRRVIRKMMNDDKTKRYATANQVLNALSNLETPPWIISVTANTVRWEQHSGQRLRAVVWTEHAPRKHEWHAWSEPCPGTKGRKLTLGSSGGIVSKSKAVKGLEEFFEI